MELVLNMTTAIIAITTMTAIVIQRAVLFIVNLVCLKPRVF